MNYTIVPGRRARQVSRLGLAFVCAVAAAIAVARTPETGATTTMKVSIVDLRGEQESVSAARATEMAREGIVLLFEGIDVEAAADIVRAAASDAIAYDYALRGAVLAKAAADARVTVYAQDGAPFGMPIPATPAMQKSIVDRVHELGLRNNAALKLARVPPGDVVATVTEAPAEKVKCRTERVLGTRVRKQRVCYSQEDILAARDRADDIQNRGAPDEAAVPSNE